MDQLLQHRRLFVGWCTCNRVRRRIPSPLHPLFIQRSLSIEANSSQLFNESKFKYITVEEHEHEMRLDRLLNSRFEFPNSLLQKLLRKNQVRVSICLILIRIQLKVYSKTKDQDQTLLVPVQADHKTRLVTGQIIAIPRASASLEERPKDPNVISERDVDRIRSCIIYKDESVIALNKPQGLATQGRQLR